jgi:hypothetical protein
MKCLVLIPHRVVLKARLRVIELELESERHRRQEAEVALMDVRRECKEPFVVPALLDAFIRISQLTTDALGPGDSRGRWREDGH